MVREMVKKWLKNGYEWLKNGLQMVKKLLKDG